MTLGGRGSRMRCLFVWTGAGLALLATWRVTRGPATDGWTAATHGTLALMPLDRALAGLAAALALACAAWMWLVTTAVVLEAARGGRGAMPGRRRVRGVPVGVHRLVLAACGVAVVSGLAQPALAQASDLHRDRGHDHPRAVVHSPVAGLPLPERAAVSGPTVPTPARTVAESPSPAARAVVVRAGDSLWSIAARDLGPGSPNAEVTARWHAIYAANRSRIGPDPDVILPGLRLLLPGKDPS